jgi:chemotaxis signal transduction protein
MNDIVSINTADIQPPPELDGADTSMVYGLVRIFDRPGEDGQQAKGTMVSLIDVPALRLTRALDNAA